MIDKLLLLDIIHSALEGTDKFLVDLKINTDNRIYVSIDGDEGINIDDCIELSRIIESNFDRDQEDFELNVASPGLDTPLKLSRQYKKNIGRLLSVDTFDGKYMEGELIDATNESFTIQPFPGKNRIPVDPVTFLYCDVKAARIIVEF